MMYDSLLARSFSKQEQRKLAYGALAASVFIALSFFIILNPDLGPLPILNLKLFNGDDNKLSLVKDTGTSLQMATDVEVTNNEKLVNRDTSSSQEVVRDAEIIIKDPLIEADVVTKKQKIDPPLCNIMGRSDFCEIKGDIRIDRNSSVVFIVTSERDILASGNTSWSIRPYARKNDQTAMSSVREWTVKLVAPGGGLDIPQCTQNHSVPAILFSVAGYAGNHFHAFTDVIVPLFSTTRPYNGEVQFLVTNSWPRWIAKFARLLKGLSRYDVMDIDARQDVHCFENITVGLKGRSNKELTINPSQSPYSMKDFRQFLRSSCSLNKTTAAKIRDGEKKRPRLLIISRKKSRAFTNVGEIDNMAKRLGYEVVVAEPNGSLTGFAQMINSCDVVMGVHGAGLTNIVFLPEKAILIQVVPFGVTEWVSRISFEEPAKDMNIRYLDYKISLEESTLMRQYPEDHVVLRDPSVIHKQGWVAFRSIYLDNQNVTLDVNRFRPSLVKALQLLHQ